MKIKNKRAAFTLIELLVVIVIIGILATIGVATFQSYRDQARKAKLAALDAQTRTQLLAQTIVAEKEVIGRWSLNGTLEDQSANQFHMSLLGTGVGDYEADSIYEDWTSFPSTDGDFPLATIPLSYWPNEEFTITFLGKVNRDSPSSLDTFVHMGSYYIGRPTVLLVRQGTQFRAVLQSFSGGTTQPVYSSITTETGEWYHHIVSYDGDVFKIYIDGELAAEESVGTMPEIYGGGSAVGIMSGAGWYDGRNPIDGHVNNIEIYPVSYTPS